jgi:hypothetical protein
MRESGGPFVIVWKSDDGVPKVASWVPESGKSDEVGLKTNGSFGSPVRSSRPKTRTPLP